MGKILVPIDGSDFTERVVSEACELAQRYQLDLVLINVQTLSQYPSVYMSTEIREAEEERHQKIGRKILEEGKKMAQNYTEGVQILTQVLFGNPAERILDYADDQEVDLIVIGSRGVSDINRFLLGGVSSRVINHSHQSVLVVK